MVHVYFKRRPFVRLLAVVALAAHSTTLTAGTEDAAIRGAKVVDEWCRICHLRASDSPDPDMAPPYEEIVRRPGRDKEYFVRFLDEDHFPMTTFRLFDDEKRDVVEYLLFLQRH